MATGRLGTPTQLAATTNTTIYTVPSGTYAVFNVSLTNISNSSVTVRLAMASSGTPSTAEWIEYDTVIVGKGVLERTGIVLDAGKNVVAWASAATSINVNVFGIETSTT